MIQDVLQEAGHPLGANGRTSCPIHGGRNPQAFRYTDRGFQCFSCGEHGGERRLRECLGLTPPERPKELDGPLPEGLEEYGDLAASPFPPWAQRPSVLLAEAHDTWRARMVLLATTWHRHALDVLDHPPRATTPLAQARVFRLLTTAHQLLDVAHRTFRRLDALDVDCCARS